MYIAYFDSLIKSENCNLGVCFLFLKKKEGCKACHLHGKREESLLESLLIKIM